VPSENSLPSTRPTRQRAALAGGAVRIAVGLLVAAITLASCTNDPAEPRARVSIYGIDGATWAVIDPLLAAGELPTLRRLIEDGTRAPLRSIKPLVSPPVWTTIATGVPRARHGIDNFIVKGRKHVSRPGGRLISSQDRKIHALWNIASQFDLRVAVLGWWATYPAEEVDGVIVSERALKTREDDLASLFGGRDASQIGLAYPPEVFPEIASILTRTPDLPADTESSQVALRSLQIEDQVLAELLRLQRTARGPFDLELVLMRGVDVISHHFWKYHEPDAPAYDETTRPSPAEVAKYGEVVRDHYREVDRLIGGLIEGKRDSDVVLIVSDHGFEAGMQPQRDKMLSGTHKSDAALDGIFIASGGPFRKGAQLDTASILDITPTVLRLLGLPIAETITGKPLDAALDADWLKAHPIRHVGAYQGPPVQIPEGGLDNQSPVDEAVLEQLRRLGYLE